MEIKENQRLRESVKQKIDSGEDIFIPTHPTKEQEIDSELYFFARLLVWVFGIIPFLAGLSIIGYQSLTWLQHGYWVSISPLDAITAIAEPGEAIYQWARRPDSWLGLHKTFESIPLSVSLLFLSSLGSLLVWALPKSDP